MSNSPQPLLASIERGLNALNISRLSEEQTVAYIRNEICPLLRKAIAHIVPTIKKRHEMSANQSNLVHYTNVDTLIKILECGQSGYLRLYDSAHFNDPDEGRYLTRITREDNDASRWLSTSVEGHAYIASFVVDKQESNNSTNDDLVFWRTYGNDGHGCSIEIPAMQFVRKELLLLQVFYGRCDAMRTLKELENPVLGIRDALNVVTNNDYKVSIERLIKRTVAD